MEDCAPVYDRRGIAVLLEVTETTLDRGGYSGIVDRFRSHNGRFAQRTPKLN